MTGKVLLRMSAVALVVRLAVSVLAYPEFLRPERNHWAFGNEVGQVATSLYYGHGFSSPFFVPSGPTALLPPAYPYLMFLCMKLFNGYTGASALAILSLNSLFAAITVVPVYFLALRLFGEPIARAAGWTWALFPYSIYLAGARIWGDTLTCMMASFLLWQTLRLEKSDTTREWLLWGALWGMAAMVSPVLLSPLPFLGLWLVLRRRKAGRSWFLPSLASAVVCLALIAPWTIRNYNAFHRFIPLRDGFWLEVHRGNSGDTSDLQPDSTAPPHSPDEYAQWVSLGEIGYLEAKKAEAKSFIREHPGFCSWVSFRRIVCTWTGFWTLDPKFLANEPFHIPNVFFTTAMTLLMAVGLRCAWQNGKSEAILPLLLVLIVFPLIFYLTHPSMDYRHPLDPIIVIFACYGITEWLRARRSGPRFWQTWMQ